LILARAISADRREDLEVAFARMGLPARERDRLAEPLSHVHLLLTGLGPPEWKALTQLRIESAPGDFPRFLPGEPGWDRGTGLLTGYRSQFEALLARLGQQSPTTALRNALKRALASEQVPVPLQVGGRTLVFGRRTYLMGVVNVTPDSFSDGGAFLDPDRAIEQGMRLVESGADLLDVGGESTRPGAPPVDSAEEIRRVIPVIAGLCSKTDVPISVDTRKAVVAQQAIGAGARMVNDISGFQFDPLMPGVVARSKAACCLMHIQGTPETMQKEPHYRDLMAEIIEFLSGAVDRAVEAEVEPARILIDPGIGFGKTVGQNLTILRRLSDLRQLGRPILVGTSRKSFLGALTGKVDPAQRNASTLASIAAIAAAREVDIVRVHDVAEAREALRVANAIGDANDAGELLGGPGNG
jgi:dihydropteroate synthase